MIKKLQESPFLSLGFRPFYLLASGFCVISFVVFLFAFTNPAKYPNLLFTYHSHELVFGFASAVLVGFLLTAVQNWTQRRTLWGIGLACLALLWIAGRIANVIGTSPISSVVSSLFLPLATLAIALPIFQSRNYRNLPLVLAVAFLAMLNTLYHAREAGVVSLELAAPEPVLALSFFALVITLMAGRVIPAFTRNALPSANVRTHKVIDLLAFLSIGVVVLAELISFVPNYVFSGVALLGLVAHGYRLWCWDPLATRSEPLLWILPIGYLWILIYLGLEMLQFLDMLQTPTLPLHALTSGAIGCLMIGMMSRSARGHTGRPLKSDRWDLLMFLLVLSGSFARVFGMLLLPASSTEVILVSGALWAAGFLVFFMAYFKCLTQPRIDAIT